MPLVAAYLGVLFLQLFYIVNDGRTGVGAYDFSRQFIVLWVGIALSAGWLIWRVRRPQKIVVTSLHWPLLCLLLASFISLLASQNPLISQEFFILYLLYFFFFLMAIDLAHSPWLTEIVLAATLSAAAIIILRSFLLLILFSQSGLLPSLATLPRFAAWGTAMGDPNRLAVYLVPLICLALHKLVSGRPGSQRKLIISLLILLLVALMLTQSRGGLLGFVAAMAVYGFLFTRRSRKAASSHSPNYQIGAVVAAGALALTVSGFILINRQIDWQDTATQTRIETIRGAINVLLAHPWVGGGPGTMGEVALQYQQPTYGVHTHAHNLGLTVIAEVGLLGGVGIIWLALIFVRQLGIILRSRPKFPADSLRIALTATLVGFTVHTMLDTFLDFPVGLSMMAGLFGLWAGLQMPQRPLPGFWNRAIHLTLTLILVMITVSGFRSTQGTRAYYQAVHVSNFEKWREMVDYTEQAIALSPPSWIYRRQLGKAYGFLAAEDVGHRDQAITHYEAALQAGSPLPVDRANLACLLWDEGDTAAAVRLMAQARDADPNNGLYRFNLGYYFEKQGEYAQAWTEYAHFLSWHPRYLKSKYWQQTKARRDDFSLIVAQAVDKIKERYGDPSLNLASFYTEGDYLDKALATYDQLPNSEDQANRLALGRAEVLLAMDQFDQALLVVDEVIDQNPESSLAHQYRGKIYLQQAQLDRAAQDTELALQMSRSSVLLYQRGQIAEKQDEIGQALQHYEAAIHTATAWPNFQTEYPLAARVLSRRVLPAETYLPCLQRIYVTPELVAPALARGALLEQAGQSAEAVKNYQTLLKYEPEDPQITRKLRHLCQAQPHYCEIE